MSKLLQIQGGKTPAESCIAKGLVCVFHGYGADRENLYPVAKMLSAHNPDLRFVVPNGIQRFEHGGDGFQWFSLMDRTQPAMQKGLEAVTPKISDWIKTRLQELNLTEENLYLVGFSQGAMLSLYLTASGLLSPKKVIAYSGLFVPPSKVNSSEKNVDVLAFHGDYDQVLPMDMTKISYGLLPKHGIKNLNFNREYGVDHYITESAILKGAKFLSEVE